MKKHGSCAKEVLPVRDAIEILGGKWTIPLLMYLCLGNKRFNELKSIGISSKILSKELKELEINGLVERIENKNDLSVEYALTEYGQSLRGVIESIREWGAKHREHIREKILNGV